MKHTNFSLDFFCNELPSNNQEVFLVTGACGYIGHHLIDILVANNVKVRVYDNFTFENKEVFRSKFPNVEIVEGDINDPIKLAQAMVNVKTIIALAAIVGDPACSVNFLNTYNVNYNSTRVLVDLANFYRVKKIVFASSCSVYGESLGNEFLTEESDLNPVSSYAYSRIVSENYLKENCHCEFVILRLATVFGISQRMRFDLVVNLLTAKAFFEQKAFIFGGDQWRPFLHCRDAARAFYAAAISNKDINGEIFNVGSTNENFKLKELKPLIEAIVPGSEIILENNITDNRNYKVDFSKIKQELGFEVETRLSSGISEMVESFRHKQDLDIKKAVYSNFEIFKLRDKSLN